MTDIDISPEAVERMACILDGRGGFVKGNVVVATLRALSAALTQSRAERAAAYERAAEMIREYPHFMLMTPDQKKVCVHLAQVILALRDKPAPAVTVREAARVLLTYLSETQDSVVWETTEDAMAVPMADPGDVIFSALRAIAGGGDE